MKTQARVVPCTFVAVLLFSAAVCSRPVDLPSYGAVPRVDLKDELGRVAFAGGPADQVTIYDFIFTRCAGTCPLMSRRMVQLAVDLSAEQGIRFVSISVDPEHDTPEVLRAYKSHFGEEPRWHLLTGERSAIIDLSVKGFKLAAGAAPAGADEPIIHSTKFVLVDRGGLIRGYYDLYREEEMARLAAEAKALEASR